MSSEADTQEIDRLYEALIGAATSDDAETYAALFVEDGAIMAPHFPAVVGQPAMIDWLTALFSTWAVEVDSFSVDARSVGDRVAFVRWSAAGTYRRKDGGEGVPYDQKYLDTFVKPSGQAWRFAVHMVNSNVEDASIWPSWAAGGAP